MRLYTFPRSGNAYKPRLLLALIGVAYEAVEVDLTQGAHRTPEYLALNPLGQVPVLVDGALVLRDSQAILVYLARRYGAATWLPVAAEPLARISQWLAFAANEVQHGAALARAVVRFKRDADLGKAQALAQRALDVVERHVSDGRSWLETDHPTVADVACYPYLALAPEGEVSIDPYPGVKAWIRRIEQLPGYVPMQGLPRRE